jgi:hypothetical protein
VLVRTTGRALLKAAPWKLAASAYENMQNSQEVQPKALIRLVKKLNGMQFDKEIQSMMITAILYTLKPLVPSRIHFLLAAQMKYDHDHTDEKTFWSSDVNHFTAHLFSLYCRLVYQNVEAGPSKGLRAQAVSIYGSAAVALIRYEAQRASSAESLRKYMEWTISSCRQTSVFLSRSDATILSVISNNEYVARKKSFVQIVEKSTDDK